MSVNTPSFISSLKIYRDSFRGYVVVNYILLVITPFLVIMSLFLIYYPTSRVIVTKNVVLSS